MLEISNIRFINQTYGHVIGNATIQAFSDVLSGASVGLCFVGRNGGNKFMALFEECTEEKLNVFLNRVRQKTEAHNLQKDVPWIEYCCGRAFNEGSAATTITQLISLADRRIANRSDHVTGIANREGCDEIIAQYRGHTLPQDLACVMFDFVNLKEINLQEGRIRGDAVLRRFSDFLRDDAQAKTFVGRNGGTRFLAIIEECTSDKLDAYVNATSASIEQYNSEGGHPAIKYSWGIAFNEQDVTAIEEMLTLASERIRDHKNY